MKERGVADRAYHVPVLTGVRDAARDRDRCAHADCGVDYPELETERVAPDIAWIDRVLEDLFYRIECPAVQAACTEDRGAGQQARVPVQRAGTGFSGILPSPRWPQQPGAITPPHRGRSYRFFFPNTRVAPAT